MTARSRLLLATVAIGIVVIGVLGGRPAWNAAQRYLADRRQEAQILRQRSADEIVLRQCAATLDAAMGERDAAESIRIGDYRLRMLLAPYHWHIEKIVPGVMATGPGDMSMPAEITGTIIGRDGLWRVRVAISPKGRIWTDPSSPVQLAGKPASADACAVASRAYVQGYNRVILSLPPAQTAPTILRLKEQ